MCIICISIENIKWSGLSSDTDLSNCVGIKSEIKSANFESNSTKGFENIAVMFRLTNVRIWQFDPRF